MLHYLQLLLYDLVECPPFYRKQSVPYNLLVLATNKGLEAHPEGNPRNNLEEHTS